MKISKPQDMSEVLLALKVARAYEKVAVADARRRAQERVEQETKEAHEQLLDAVRAALVAGESARQIGVAYGSSDARTVKRLIEEAMADGAPEGSNDHPEWRLSKNSDGTFNIRAYALGDAQMSGQALCVIDEDGENFSVIDGDMWIQIQLYRLGYKDDVIKEATA